MKNNMLTIIGISHKDSKSNLYVNVECNCGNKKTVRFNHFKNGGVKSCGCIRKEVAQENLVLARIAAKKFNQFILTEKEALVILPNENIMICDIEDWNIFMQHHWSISTWGYARTTLPNNKTVNFHVMLLAYYGIHPDPGLITDHINRNKLDNRKCNLRIANKRCNTFNTGEFSNNTSGRKGVFARKDGKYEVYISKTPGSYDYAGRYDSFEEACVVRSNLENQYHSKYLESSTTIESLVSGGSNPFKYATNE